MERPGAATDQILACNLLGARDRHAELARDVRDGLSRPLKEIPPKYFYDARGSELFERITRLPEYYLTRVETEILERRATDFVSELGSHVLVEYGSGSSTKTRLLLDAMQEVGSLEQYAPVDVSEEALRTAADSLVREYPNLQVVIVIADFESPLDLSFAGRPRLVAFLGSTIGNFTSATARTFVRSVARQLGSGDGFLIGFDLVKDTATLEAAYNDSAGVTAAFNQNLLRVLNRELSADFDVEGFSHRAYYDAEKARIELHLVARGQQVVSIRDLEMEVAFAAGESIRTELSHKYTRESAVGLLEASGMRIRRWETDERNRFAVAIAEPV
jgi:L-histidine N-alpha-methyltransferase